jgi:hypothetical protein
MGTTPLAGFSLLISGVPTEVRISDGRTATADPDQVRERQIPLPSLLLATVLCASLWWGIIAGVRWIWVTI